MKNSISGVANCFVRQALLTFYLTVIVVFLLKFSTKWKRRHRKFSRNGVGKLLVDFWLFCVFGGLLVKIKHSRWYQKKYRSIVNYPLSYGVKTFDIPFEKHYIEAENKDDIKRVGKIRIQQSIENSIKKSITENLQISVGELDCPLLTASREALVFMSHGSFGNRKWKESGIMEIAVKEGFRALAIDFPGEGDLSNSKARKEITEFCKAKQKKMENGKFDSENCVENFSSERVTNPLKFFGFDYVIMVVHGVGFDTSFEWLMKNQRDEPSFLENSFGLRKYGLEPDFTSLRDINKGENAVDGVIFVMPEMTDVQNKRKMATFKEKLKSWKVPTLSLTGQQAGGKKDVDQNTEIAGLLCPPKNIGNNGFYEESNFSCETVYGVRKANGVFNQTEEIRAEYLKPIERWIRNIKIKSFLK